jgi:hypothetical protein
MSLHSALWTLARQPDRKLAGTVQNCQQILTITDARELRQHGPEQQRPRRLGRGRSLVGEDVDVGEDEGVDVDASAGVGGDVGVDDGGGGGVGELRDQGVP